ncbi:Ulp1 family isopeptidase [Cystobacter fuscus]|uniref:Ulp1 family isopeptidase n=1 Tax=Cystobacter fuscus TaxID=43 RepID=UPI0037BF9039
MDGFGSVWGLSVTGSDFRIHRKQQVVPSGGSVSHRNWVRYLHTPDIWEDDTAAHWKIKESGAVPWNEGGKKARVQKILDERDAFWGLVGEWCGIIEGASQLIDITSLEVPAPGGKVGTKIINSIANKVKGWRTSSSSGSLVIRLLFGGTPQSETSAFKTALENAIGAHATKENGEVIILFGTDYRGVAFRSYKFASKNKTWNHSKIVAADGWRAITGGHNMNAEVSYTRAPVIHDLSVEVFGHGAQLAHDFASSLWEKAHSSEFLDGYFYDANARRFVAIQPDHLLTARQQVQAVREFHADPHNNLEPGDDYVPADAVMGLGRWGDVEANGVTGNGVQAGAAIPGTHGFQYCSDLAKRLLIAGAEESICVSQQDLVSAAWKGMIGYSDAYHDACHALGKRLASPRPIEINVVVSARYAQDSGGAPYSYGNSPRLARDLIAKFAGSKIPIGNVCTVAPLVFCRAEGVDRGHYIWPDAWRGWTGFVQGHAMQSYGDLVTIGFGPGNHAKALMIDDEVVLIGSDNMYPSPLAEFSFVIEGAEAVGKFREVYWSKMWKYSRRMGLKVDHNNKVDSMNPHADFKAFQKSAAADKNAIGLKLKTAKDEDATRLVQALSVIEQITKAKDLESCYRALRFLRPEADLSKVSPEEMRDHVYGEYLSASSASVKKPMAKAPVLSAVKPWKDVEGVKLTMSHKDMLNSEEEWLDDRVMDAYVASLVRNSNVHCRYDVPVGRFVGAGGNVPNHLNQVRNGGNADCEVQVLNVNNSHWILAVRFPRQAVNAAFVYNSLGDAPTEEVKAQVRRCFGLQRAASVTQLVGPRQPSGHECGPFVCAAIERLVVDHPATIGEGRQALVRGRFDNVTIRRNILRALDS